MKLFKLSDFKGGWIVGDFHPSVIKTKDFEFCVKNYETGQKDDVHVHNKAQEITIIVSGAFKFNDRMVKKDDIVCLEKGETSDFECLEAGSIACVKTPSVIGDKQIIEKS